MNEQHNHHCLLSFMGFNWWIVESRPGVNQLKVARRINTNAVIVANIDTARVNWENYAKAAVRWDYEKDRTSQA